MKKLSAVLYILIYNLCCSLSAIAQNSNFVLHDIKLPQEFNQQIISCLEQDKSGLLWFVTNNGLHRFDGSNVIHLGSQTKPSIPHTQIIKLFADKQNNLWIGAKDGLTRLNLKTWTAKEVQSKPGMAAASLYIRTICEGHQGDIYAGSEDGKVYKIVKDSLSLVFDLNRSLPDLHGLPGITFIQEPYPNQLWIGTSAGKLVHIAVKADGSYSRAGFYGPASFNGEQIINATFSASGICLILVAHHGLFTLNTQTGIFSKVRGKYEDLEKNGQVFMTPLDNKETLLMTNTPAIGKRKLLIYNFQKDTIFEQDLRFPGYLKDNHIVRFSHSGSMILLALNGLLMELAPSSSPFKALMDEPISLNSIRAIYKVPGGPLYVGSYKDGFVRMEEPSERKEVISRKYVYSILPWNSDSLLLSTEGNGLLWYEPAKNRISSLDIPENRAGGASIGNYTTFVLRHSEDQLLVGTYERLYMVNPYKKTARAIRSDLLFKTRILSLLFQGGNYFIATENGILKWNPVTDALDKFWQNDSSKADKGQNNKGRSQITVYGMAAIGDQIWAGTDGEGIVVLNSEGKLVDTVTRAGGLASDIVYTLTATEKYILAGTQNGLSVINRKSGQIINYSTLDQLPANEFNSAAAYQTGDTVYLGTIDGVVRFNTAQLRDTGTDLSLPSVYITDLAITDHKGKQINDYTWPYHENEILRIKPRTEYFSIDFGHMGGPAMDLNYYYRLQEDQPWSLLGVSRKLSFVGMAPGTYQLQLAACLPDGKWTKPMLNLPLIVAAAFYQTAWFKILVGLLIIGIGWLIFKYRERQKDKERQLRLKIAGDLHDEIGSSLAGISMQADMLLSGYDKDMKEYLESIAENGRLAVQTMGDIVWSVDPRNDDSVSLFQRMERYGHKLFGASSISIEFHKDEMNERLHVSQKVRQNVMLIYKEALTNIIKHASASRVEVSFVPLEKGFKLVIADNGKGVTREERERLNGNSNGHGLRNIKMRAAAIGAQLDHPEVEKGLTIVLIWKG